MPGARVGGDAGGSGESDEGEASFPGLRAGNSQDQLQGVWHAGPYRQTIQHEQKHDARGEGLLQMCSMPGSLG